MMHIGVWFLDTEETRQFCKCSSLIKLDKGPRDRQVDTPGEFSVP